MVLVGVVILRDCSALLLLSLAAPSMQVKELWLQTTTKRERHRRTAAPTRLIVSEAARLSLD